MQRDDTSNAEPSLLIVGARKRGRPPTSEPMSPVSAWVPAAAHKRIKEIAKERRVSVSKVVSHLLTRRLDAST